MKKFLLSVATAAALASPALAADLKMVTKAPPPPPSPWDAAFGAALSSDYIFRGITQSNHKPSVNAYFESRFNATKDVQFYAGVSGSSISFPNRAAAEIDFSAGFRPTFGPLALDFGAVYYWYPGGLCFNAAQGADCLTNADPITLGLPVNGNVIKANLSFFEVYARAGYTVNDYVSLAAQAAYSPSVLNSGADGTYIAGSVKFTAPSTALPNGLGMYASAEVGHWFLGTSDSFYCTGAGGPCIPPFPGGIPYASYTTWNLGIGFTKSVFTLDLRYYDTDLSKGDCNAFTSDHTARFTNSFTSINIGGFGSSWCSSTFVVSGKFDLTAMANLK
jgi:opacity protein-like surface antigen